MVALSVLGILLACMIYFESRTAGRSFRTLLALHVFMMTMGYLVSFAVNALTVWSVLVRATGRWSDWHTYAMRSTAWWLTMTGLALTALGLVLGSFGTREKWGTYWSWDIAQVGSLGVLASYCVMLACLLRQRSSRFAELVVGVLGNAVVSLSWCGLHMFGRGMLPSSDSSHIANAMGGFVVFQVIVLAVSCIPVRESPERFTIV
jgi:ABC-type transport system involved in cytochrome c biogenesis permease subunit